MLTASKNILQEEWVQCWLDKLTPKQQALVIEVLKDGNKPQKQKPIQATVQEVDTLLNLAHPTVVP
jgi:hypothetical protein